MRVAVGKSASAPLPLAGIILFAAALVVVLLTVLSRAQPWLGLELVSGSDGQGLIVDHVDPGGPSAGVLKPGDVVVGIIDNEGQTIPLHNYVPRLEPHTLATFQAYNAYLVRQGRIWAALTSGTHATLITAGGSRKPIARDTRRPIHSLPAAYWWFHGFGITALLLGTAVWVFRPRQAAARALALSGLGFFIATATNSYYLARELAISEHLFRALSYANHWALTLMLGAILSLLIHYPRRLGGRTLPAALVAALVLYQLNENLQWVDWPVHTFYLPLVCMYLAGIALAVRQWQLARFQPLDRAALKWVFLSVLLTMGTCMIIYFVPALVGAEPLMPQAAMVGFAVLMYLGFVLGVLRYRLFELEHWWFRAWAWFLAGLAVISMDLVLAWITNLGDVQALAVALLVIGWLYFPLRQWIWGRLTRTRPELERQLPHLVHILLDSRTADEAETRWREVLRDTFAPLHMTALPMPPPEPQVRAQGATLEVPGIRYGGYELQFREEGQRLFDSVDVERAHCLLMVARRICDIRHAHDEGARSERRRIIRDLHDDVGARILTLVHHSESSPQAETARAALRSLRESMRALDDEEERLLHELLFDIRFDIERRIAATGAELHWDQSALPHDVSLQPREAINLRRIVDEAITNALQHAAGRSITIRLRWSAGALKATIENLAANSLTLGPGTGRGRGLKNMATRAREINATLRTETENGWFRVHVYWPFPAPSSP